MRVRIEFSRSRIFASGENPVPRAHHVVAALRNNFTRADRPTGCFRVATECLGRLLTTGLGPERRS
jgi:hypothetical protein